MYMFESRKIFKFVIRNCKFEERKNFKDDRDMIIRIVFLFSQSLNPIIIREM